MDLSPLTISLKVALWATLFASFFGLWAARFVLTRKRLKWFFDGLFTLPLILPPTVIGFLLLMLLGKQSLLGMFFDSLNVTIIFSWVGAVIASFVVAFPLMYRTAKGAFEQIDPHLIDAARTLGLSEWRLFFKIIIPLSWPGIIAGIILCFARALGEFGATIMIAGNIPGKTQTMALTVYTAVQLGDNPLAFKWVTVLVILSFVMIFLIHFLPNCSRKLNTKRVKE